MRRILYAVLAVSLLLAMTGCGGSNPPPTFATQILSNPNNDGDVELDVSQVFHVTQGSPGSIFAGVDPTVGGTTSGSEFQAFLDFPLIGAGGVPGSALINSATLDIYVDSIAIQAAASSIPLQIDLVSFTPSSLSAAAFTPGTVPALASITTNIFRSDVGQHALIDVTPLMVQAQISQVNHFQLRILEAFGNGVLSGLVEIDDSPTRPARQPLLDVVYH